ncbi:hypothetical protein BOTCAL_0074g00390 [Botryotinia calthae]|uniref:Uncharacterized protein n=1 Tax=Botryotinia calthae TaxID=38488 RepID=A0A4Y8DB08_9HELO|nr:hypothetical protein BOTCAL_0074g00390 [Botryotinia calthae]
MYNHTKLKTAPPYFSATSFFQSYHARSLNSTNSYVFANAYLLHLDLRSRKDVKERGFDISLKDMGESSYIPPLDPNLIPSDQNLVPSYSLSELLQEISRVNIAIEKKRRQLAEMSTDQVTRQNRSINNTTIDTNSGRSFLKAQQLSIFPMDEVLKISHRLIRTIQDITSLISIQEKDSLISTEPSPGRDDIDAAVSLILACYLNLLRVFDKFFSDTSTSPGASGPKFALPLTKVGEFVVPRTMTGRSERALIYETAQATHSLLHSPEKWRGDAFRKHYARALQV